MLAEFETYFAPDWWRMVGSSTSVGRIRIVGRETRGAGSKTSTRCSTAPRGGLLKAGWSFLSHEDAEAKARELEAASRDA